MLAILADLLYRWGAMMQRPLHEPTLPPPPRDFAAMIDDARATTPLDAILPSTDYRTNPRPAQMPVTPRCYY